METETERWKKAWEGVKPVPWESNAYYQNRDYLLPAKEHKRRYGWS